jgi:hypothetical protein
MRTVDQLLHPLVGELCWQARWDNQLGLDLNFGRPSLRIRKPYHTRSKARVVRAAAARRLVTVRGEYWLWILMGRWRITLPDHRRATAVASIWTKDIVCNHFQGEVVTSFEVAPETGRTQLRFDLGSTLDIWRPRECPEEELWSLYTPGGWVLTVRGDGTYSHGRASARDRWQPISRRGAT